MDIIFENVTYIYQPNSPFQHIALQDVTFQIKSGSYVAIVGHTGSGKSTLISHLNGLTIPTEGTVSIGDYSLSKEQKPNDMKGLRSRVGVVFQYPEHQLFEETVEKDIAFGPDNFGIPKEEIKRRMEEIVPAVGLPTDVLQRSPFDLSGGQMRRVAIAGVLAVKPEVLVLDEPTAGLDPRGQREIMDMFYQLHKEQSLTTVLVTHSMEDALKYADHVIILNNGKKYMEGKPEEVFTQKDALHKVQLDVPEIVQFLMKFNHKFSTSLPFKKQTIKELAETIQHVVRGAESS
ncbi:energy-coupling factor ABC transporter ATP-binding protein [Oceanobacillus bengalensis]|uniref:Energy-coupling factor transporter ATP-binding protein EcfA2 n=1 Tax=Oceanobacillus bengalensis TaxID=1435466 RepID=A0A494YW27_9BACI|nr:energy-coupling factor ABC transporter ATP-binding protein [Oceanobacillus bengalensis]RKQ14238.1 energy-coupling factor ABC transporter ATP-binding protein [Oceanobacillus bengalensis]